MSNYEITLEAKKDLKNIARYTDDTWGRNQTRAYERKLIAGFDKIGRGNFVERKFKKAGPDIFLMHCEHHFIFYLRRKSSNPVIFAVLHEHMDLINQIKLRLKNG